MNQFKFRLFVTGQNQVTEDVVSAINRVCKNILSGTVELEIVDVLQNRNLAEQEKIFDTPTLIKDYPFPKRRISGDLSDYTKLLSSLYSGNVEH